jgi:hypothetical protein
VKPYVYEDIVDDPAKAQTCQIEVTTDGEIVNRTTSGRFKDRVVKIAKIADAPNDPQIELIKKTLETPEASGADLEKQLNDAREKLKLPKIRWLKDAAPVTA